MARQIRAVAICFYKEVVGEVWGTVCAVHCPRSLTAVIFTGATATYFQSELQNRPVDFRQGGGVFRPSLLLPRASVIVSYCTAPISFSVHTGTLTGGSIIRAG